MVEAKNEQKKCSDYEDLDCYEINFNIDCNFVPVEETGKVPVEETGKVPVEETVIVDMISVEKTDDKEMYLQKNMKMFQLLFHRSMTCLEPANHMFIQLMNLCNIKTLATVLMDNQHNILHANSDWIDKCGYNLSDIVGKKLTILQGSQTNKEKVLKFMESLYSIGFGSVCLLNFTKDKKPFWNHIWATKFICCEETYFISMSEVDYIL